MKEQLALLVQMQDIDLGRQKDKAFLAAFPEKMTIAEKPLLDAKAEIEAVNASVLALNLDRKDKELNLEAIEEKIIKLKMRLTELKTNKEYHAHLQEIAAARKEKSDTEDALLAAMEQSDTLKADIEAKESALQIAESEFSGIRDEMQTEFDEVTAAAEKVEARWNELTSQIPAPLLKKYTRLMLVCKGTAVVPVTGQTCTGCHFSQPPQLIAEVKKQTEISSCTYCHRILYFPIPIPAVPE